MQSLEMELSFHIVVLTISAHILLKKLAFDFKSRQIELKSKIWKTEIEIKIKIPSLKWPWLVKNVHSHCVSYRF